MLPLKKYRKKDADAQWIFSSSSVKMWITSFDRHPCFLPREMERKKERATKRVLLTLSHFSCRKSGGANAPVTRRFPVTCCPRSMSPGTSLSRPRGVHGRAEPVPARSGSLLFLTGVPVVPFLDTLESMVRKFSRIQSLFSDESLPKVDFIDTTINAICI